MSDLYVRTFGEGPPVLFLHAGIATGAQWEPAARFVAATGRTAIVPDLRGFGASPDPSAPYDHVADLVEILDESGAASVAVAGWSMGGVVACSLAARHPGRVRALALINSVPAGYRRAPAVLRSWELEAELWAAGRDEDMVRNDLETWVAGVGRTLDAVPSAVVAETSAVLRDIIARARAGADPEGELDMTESPPLSDVLQVGVPLLAVSSQHEHPDNDEFIDQLHTAQVDLHTAIIAGCAHAGPLERPDEYAKVLSSFLAEVDRTRGA